MRPQREQGKGGHAAVSNAFREDQQPTSDPKQDIPTSVDGPDQDQHPMSGPTIVDVVSSLPVHCKPFRSRGHDDHPPTCASTRAQPPACGPKIPRVTGIGVRRPGFGQSFQRRLDVYTNHFAITIPPKTIYHYNVVILPERSVPIPANFEIMMAVQNKYHEIFDPKVPYDGHKNIYTCRVLQNPNPSMGPDDPLEFFVMHTDTLPTEPPSAELNQERPAPKRYDVRLTRVSTINPETLARYILGQQSRDNTVLTAVMAMNIAIRMVPRLRFPLHARSFLTDRETRPIGQGIVLWRGYFQSLRPTIGRMLINVDISTGMMWKPGPLIKLLLELMGLPLTEENYTALMPRHGLEDNERIRLEKAVENVRFETIYAPGRPPRAIKKFSATGASDYMIKLDDGSTVSVTQYFARTYNINLRYPDMIGVELRPGAMIPIELCTVPSGQIMRKQVPPELRSSVLEFATKRPNERLESIKRSVEVLQYDRSEYLRELGMALTDDGEPCLVPARVLTPAVLRYGEGSHQPILQPRDGAWNMIGRKFWKSSQVTGWMVIIYESPNRFRNEAINQMVAGFRSAAQNHGIYGLDSEPLVSYQNGQANVIAQLRTQGGEYRQKTGKLPNLIVVILPDKSADIYHAVKHFGDVQTGVVTQCLKSSKCVGANGQYWANVCLKLNVKLGGVNCVPDAKSVPFLTDASNPTIVLGATVAHPAPGPGCRPSFSCLVGNVDSDTSKYVATTRVQVGRQKIIEDLSEMTEHVLNLYCTYRSTVEKKLGTPKRIIFFRDGFDEGQFQHCIDKEVARIKEACFKLKLDPMPNLTVIVIRKRNRVRFFPKDMEQADPSGNCPAGLVVDSDITDPVEFDFYLQSHGGVLGTTRPSHYNVLYDENQLTPDTAQSLTFALTQMYARATRSVSLPAPVHYAHLVAHRAKTHFDPSGQFEFTGAETALNGSLSAAQRDAQLAAFKANFKKLHANSEKAMYFI